MAASSQPLVMPTEILDSIGKPVEPTRAPADLYNYYSLMIPASTFDRVSVISDLHIGGSSGHQIFREGELLGKFIDNLRDEGSGDRALVINGDAVDFLAEDRPMCFDPEGAIDKLDNMFKEDAFKPVWKALTQFIGKPNRRLVITLGNHDLELALPWVREHFLEKLSAGDPAARSRITLALDGAGFSCQVGDDSVLCVHGNEVDTWNLTDYEALRRLACDRIQGRPLSDWTPNAGTKLVIEVMNDIKRDHAFVDLLKPEKEAALKIVWALRPDLRSKLTRIAGIARRLVWDRVRSTLRLLSEAEGPSASPGAETYTRADVNLEELMDRVEEQFQNRTDPLDIVYGNESHQLGWGDELISIVRARKPHEVAWEGVKELTADATFDIRRADDDFERIDALAGPQFRYVIAGHTHLARILGRRRGQGLYFNSGTWASLMRLKPEHIKTLQTFAPVFERLKAAKTISELGDLTFTRPTVVTVQKQNGQTKAALQQVGLENGKIVLTELQEAPG